MIIKILDRFYVILVSLSRSLLLYNPNCDK
jgi:hypothetical protein